MISKDAQKLKKFGARVRLIRLKKSWTLEDAEEHGWHSWRHLQLIETGKKNVQLLTILRLCKLFDVSVAELLRDLE